MPKLPKNIYQHLECELGRCSKTFGFHYQLKDIKKLKYVDWIELVFRHHLYDIEVSILYSPFRNEVVSSVIILPNDRIPLRLEQYEDFKKQIECVIEVLKNTNILQLLLQSKDLIEYINDKARYLFLQKYGSTG